MALTLEQTTRLDAIRRKAIDNTATIEELREAITIMRGDRVSAQAASTTSRTAAAASRAPVDTGALLAGLKAKMAG